jgi:hypothetical protein
MAAHKKTLSGEKFAVNISGISSASRTLKKTAHVNAAAI